MNSLQPCCVALSRVNHSKPTQHIRNSMLQTNWAFSLLLYTRYENSMTREFYDLVDIVNDANLPASAHRKEQI